MTGVGREGGQCLMELKQRGRDSSDRAVQAPGLVLSQLALQCLAS